MPGHDIIVIGASAGGVEALTELMGALPVDLPAAGFAALHLGAGRSSLPEILTRAGKLPAGHPVHREPIRRGRVYVAPPDRHLLVGNGQLLLEQGPKENGHRPAIDVLFRSAAQIYGPRVVGVVLTGNLDDGTAGLLEIKRRGGIAVVQDPEEADYPGMPKNAVENVAVDHVVPLAELGPLLVRLAEEQPAPLMSPMLPSGNGGEPLGQESREPNGRERSADAPEGFGELLGESGEDFGTPSGFTCPDCGGGLWEWEPEGFHRYRCRTGHAYSPESLGALQKERVDIALGAAQRSLKEGADFARRMALRMRGKGLPLIEQRYLERAAEAERNARILRTLLLTQID
jgi:two-component system chemotaxis response regulator CheB